MRLRVLLPGLPTLFIMIILPRMVRIQRHWKMSDCRGWLRKRFLEPLQPEPVTYTSTTKMTARRLLKDLSIPLLVLEILAICVQQKHTIGSTPLFPNRDRLNRFSIPTGAWTGIPMNTAHTLQMPIRKAPAFSHQDQARMYVKLSSMEQLPAPTALPARQPERS